MLAARHGILHQGFPEPIQIAGVRQEPGGELKVCVVLAFDLVVVDQPQTLSRDCRDVTGLRLIEDALIELEGSTPPAHGTTPKAIGARSPGHQQRQLAANHPFERTALVFTASAVHPSCYSCFLKPG